MANVVLILVIVGVMVPRAHDYQIPKPPPVSYEAPISPSPPSTPPPSSSPPPPPPPPQEQPEQLLRNPPIPTSVGHYLGSHQQIDPCARDEVLVRGACHRLLTRGPCGPDEYVLLDPADQKGFCAARLCAPDRIFVFSDQLCHDPLNTMMCPPGRQLYQTAYGTPLCQCPDGTYEADDDLDDDVCQPLLGESPSCPPGQVLWFRDFSRPPECLSDPCGGKNLGRAPDDLPFVPSAKDGKCYQLGQSSGVCPAQTWYSLALMTLRGVCVSLEDAGYEVFDEATLYFLTQQYGPFISREIAAPPPPSESAPASAPVPAPVPVPVPVPVPGPAQDSVPAQDPVPAPAPGPESASTPALTQHTPESPHTHFEEPQLYAGSETASDLTEQTERGIAGQGDAQGSMFPDQQKPEDQRFIRPQTYSQAYAGLEEFTGHQDDTGLATHHHTGQTSAGDHKAHAPDFHGPEKHHARHQGTLDQPGSSTVTADDDVSPLRSPDHGVLQAAARPHSPSPHITPKTSHPQSSPTHYSLPQEPTSQSSPVVPSHSQQQHPQASPSPLASTFYSLPNQPPQSSSSLPVSASASPAHHSHHHLSNSPVSSTHYSPPKQSPTSIASPSYPHNPQRSTYHSQSAFANPRLSPRLPHHPPVPSTSHSSHFTPVSLETQQVSLEVFGGPGGATVATHQFTSLPGSHVPFGSFSAEGSSSVTNGHQGHQSSSGGVATWRQNQGQHHHLHPQQQRQQHHRRGRRSTLPHASPGNVIEPLLAACRAGAQRDVNAKCREIVLPSKSQTRRDVSVSPPVPPRPTCPEGQAYGSRRKCVPVNEAIDSINAYNLGK